MKLKIQSSIAQGELEVPSSKSEAHRALICAALADGESIINNVSPNDDISATIEALIKLNAGIKIDKKKITVKGINFHQISGRQERIDCRNSGTTARLITAVSALSKNKIIVDGSTRLRERPMGDLINVLRLLGTEIICTENNNRLPFSVRGRGISGGKILLEASETSQFVSALLLISAFARKEVELTVNSARSNPYIGLTIEIMKKFGINVAVNQNRFNIKSGQKYRSVNINLLADFSSASYFFAAAALTEGKVKINSISLNSSQGDKYFLEILGKMGCKINIEPDSITVSNNEQLNGINIDMGDYPDLVPALSILSGNCKGKIIIKNIGHLKNKESDRINSISENLLKMNINSVKTADSLEINPGNFKGAVLNSFNDHRIAMSFAIAGMKANGVTLMNNFESVNKSYPEFANDLKKINADIKII